MKKIFALISIISVTLLSTLPLYANAQDNKDLVVKFYQQALIEKDVEAAAMAYLSEGYIQHNPNVPTGRQGLIDGLSGWFAAVDVEMSIVRAIAEDDFVVLHVKQVSGGKTKAVIDIFRVESGKIVEHWDVSQEVPEQMAHDNGMF
ncbi:polyketide cyclase [Amylibacter sp. SFDW26]|uniref:nuclear transport factor 2 family protein n=1 Tax=Amylibacter sp. SFDW26 TaxID=2652722 RepID=UPI0012624A19|nr:nuclear transport factor 2 family protein [Amylibacter sp. SFDW26]KAB7613291.1 polyketide cyclase [Amylibacter sp. SFDW26]